MTETPAYPGYATPTFTKPHDRWYVAASPWGETVGCVYQHPSGWTAYDECADLVGLFPDKQAAGEALVKHAGYEVLR